MVSAEAGWFSPSELALFDKTISSLSSTLTSQTSLVAGLSVFRSFQTSRVIFGSCSLPLSVPQTPELLVTLGSEFSLFDQSLAEGLRLSERGIFHLFFSFLGEAHFCQVWW